MKKINDIITKPSQAIDALVRGLVNQNARDDFKIDMSTYGETRDDVCFGCAATCTLQEMADKNFTPYSINSSHDRAEHLKLSTSEVSIFEQAMDAFRCCNISNFSQGLELLGINHAYLPTPKKTWYMDTHTWCEHLQNVQEYSNELKAKGL